MRRFVYILVLVLLVTLPVEAKKKSKAASGLIKNPVSCIDFPPNIYTNKYTYKVQRSTLKGKELSIHLEDAFSNLLFTEDVVKAAYDSVRVHMPEEYKGYNLRIYSHNEPIERYVPNSARKSLPQDARRRSKLSTAFNVVTNIDKPRPLAGLQDRNIAMWSSHGLYYNRNNERWEWMRPKMFCSVEDLLTTSIVIPYLMPMLRSAGADVYMARERDINPYEYTAVKSEGGAKYTVDVKKPGDYWIKVKYQKGADNALKLNIKHSGVESHYTLNTNVGYGTWIYIDNLRFDGPAEFTFKSDHGAKVTVDSVVIGGGMSHSGSFYPRYQEAALYNLRECGMPDSIILNQKPGVKSDYYDDIYARSKWVNFLMGGSDRFPSYPGKRIPIDLTLSLHTDAFLRDSNKVVGSLLICTSDTLYPSGYSRLASNDLASYIGYQVLNDVKAAGIEGWEWRGIWHQNYVETRVPMVPSVIVEMFSHQNFADMKIANNPQFKFLYARAIYKAALKFLADQYGQTYVVQPLAVNSFATEFATGDSVRLTWKPTDDPLEPTAYPTSYIVYTRKGGDAFDNGKVVRGTSVTLPIDPDVIYSYKVTAWNNGGESFPSEILSVCKKSNAKGSALIVNGFDRISGHGTFDFVQMAGFSPEMDFGVPYLYDISYTGPQIEYNKAVEFVNNDYPGFGASLGNYETQTIAGNTFDYTYVHGVALSECGCSYVSISKEAFSSEPRTPSKYTLLDVILGLQRNADGYELFPLNMQRAIMDFTKAGRNILISGAFTGQNGGSFANKTFSCVLRSPFAATNGKVSLPDGSEVYSLQMTPSAERYFLKNVDAIDPKYRGTEKLLFYETNRLPAALLYKKNYKSIILGFPIEALQSQEQINSLMNYLIKNF